MIIFNVLVENAPPFYDAIFYEKELLIIDNLCESVNINPLF